MLRKVLDQCAPATDVEHLHAAADGEKRQFTFDGRASQFDFETIEGGVSPAQARVREFAVERGVDVRAAGKAETVDVIQT
jgi:hypothetical protein